MIGNTEIISTISDSSTVFLLWFEYLLLHFISVNISQLQLMCLTCNCTCHSLIWLKQHYVTVKVNSRTELLTTVNNCGNNC